MLKAVLFDLDDTLIDWSQVSYPSWPEYETTFLRRAYDYITSEGHALPGLDSYINEFRRQSREAWRAGRGNLISPHLGKILVMTAELLGAAEGALDPLRVLEAYNWSVISGTVVFPEVPEILTLLRDAGVKVGIVTNAYQPMMLRDMELDGLCLMEYFPDAGARISAADAGYLKPHPAIFELAMQRVGASPEETVFVGDNPIADISGAQGVGIRAVLRRTHPVQPLLQDLIVPDASLQSLDELPAILDGWFPGWRA